MKIMSFLWMVEQPKLYIKDTSRTHSSLPCWRFEDLPEPRAHHMRWMLVSRGDLPSDSFEVLRNQNRLLAWMQVGGWDV